MLKSWEEQGRAYGANPQGQAIFAPNGRFSIMFIRSDVPKFASANRGAGTPEELKAAVNGVNKALTFHYTKPASEAGSLEHARVAQGKVNPRQLRRIETHGSAL